MIIGWTCLVVSAVLWTWQFRRFAAANPRSRFPLTGRPADTPPRTRLLNFAAIWLMVFGGIKLGTSGPHGGDMTLSVIAALLMLLIVTVPYLVHNLRVSRKRTDAV